MDKIATFNGIFDQVIEKYHVLDQVDQKVENPYKGETIEGLLYHKCWIDTVQWHLEDMIRDPYIDPQDALGLKRRIDASNQERTDLVEKIDDYYLEQFKEVVFDRNAKINTESPAWAIDRLSILALKIYHMEEQAAREDAEESHRRTAQNKLEILKVQREDLTLAISELIDDIQRGKRRMKVYRQMKMYNDPALNPVLYGGMK